MRWAVAAVPCALALGLVAGRLLLTVPYFHSHDGEIHLWRVWAFWRTAGELGLPVRWVPEAGYGYGIPHFTFYTPLPYALGAGLMALGLTAAAATKTLFLLALLLSALGAYLLGSRWGGPPRPLAGLCAAALYTLAPYRLAAVYERGALAELMGLAVAPFVLLAAVRAVDRRGIGLFGLTVGALALTHTITTVMVLPLVGALALARASEARHVTRWSWAPPLLGLALGLGIASLYWLPAVAQQATVHLERARWSADGPRAGDAFVWPWRLIQPTLVHDAARDLGEHRPPGERFPRLAAPALLATAVGGLAAMRGGWLLRRSGFVLFAALAAALALAAPPARPLWAQLEGLALVQYPYRFLGLFLLATVPLAAGLGRLGWPGLLIALATAGLALPGVAIEPIAWSPARERPAELAEFERRAGAFALGTLREHVPAAASVDGFGLLRPRGEPAEPVAPIGRARLLDATVAERRYEIAAAEPTTVLFDRFAHPSVAVWVDGVPAGARPSGDDGLLAVDLSPGNHDVRVGPTTTLVERLALAATLVALAASLTLLVGSRWRTSAAAGLVAALVLPSAAGAGDRAALVVPEVPLALDRAARVLGARVETGQVASLGTITVDLHLQVIAPPARGGTLSLWLTDASGTRVAEAVGAPGSGLRPTGRWRPNELLAARSELRLPDGLPAGRYRLGVDGFGGGGAIGDVDVATAGQAPVDALVPPPAREETVFGDGLVLGGCVRDLPGGRGLSASCWWRQAAEPTSERYTAALRLVERGAEVARSAAVVGGRGALRMGAELPTPTADLPDGSYRLELEVRGADGRTLPARSSGGAPEAGALIDWVEVRNPCRCVPPEARPVGQSFADGVELAAWSVDRRGGELTVALYWRAVAAPARNYTVFLHLMDDARRVAQLDDQPRSGRWPTGEWRPGDLVADRYRLPAPPRATHLLVGLYDGATGRRLPTVPHVPDDAARLPLDP